MRKYAILRVPMPMNQYGDIIRRIILYETKREGVFIFLSSSIEDIGCDADYWFADIESAEEDCMDYGVNREDWIEIDNPLPDCQHDFIRPVRVKGRNSGSPRFSELEVFDGFQWTDFKLERRK